MLFLRLEVRETMILTSNLLEKWKIILENMHRNGDCCVVESITISKLLRDDKISTCLTSNIGIIVIEFNRLVNGIKTPKI